MNHSCSRAAPNKSRLGGRWLLDPTCDVQCRGQSPRRSCDYSLSQCACVLLASSQCLLWLYLPVHDLQTKYRDAAEPHRRIRALTASVSLFRSCAGRHIQLPLGEQVVQIGAQQIGPSRSFACLRPPIFRSQTDSHDVAIGVQPLGFAGLLQ